MRGGSVLLVLLLAGCQSIGSRTPSAPRPVVVAKPSVPIGKESAVRSAANEIQQVVWNPEPVSLPLPVPEDEALSDTPISSISPVLSSSVSEWPSPLVAEPLRLTPKEQMLDDAWSIAPVLWDDAKSLATWENGAILGTGVAISLVLRANVDDEVRRTTARHPDRWGDASKTLGYLGDARIQVPALAAAYVWSVNQDDPGTREMMQTLIRAYAVVGLGNTAIKGITNTSRPSRKWMDGEYGFPSHHTASAFAISAVLDEYYGPEVGVPAYLVSGLIGWSRIDERDHDVSDVVFGSILGYVVGKGISKKQLGRESTVELKPFMHPTELTTGIGLEFSY